jgi:O-antigen/teichoic acid export membrane protein
VNIEKNSNQGLWKLVLTGASGTLALKIISLSLGFLINVILARLLGVKDFGAYAFSLSWAGLLGVPAVMGLDNFLVRKISIYHNQREWSLMRGALNWANKNSCISSFSLGGLAFLGALILRNQMEPAVFETFCIAMLLLPLTASARIRQAVLQGLNKITLGQMPEQIIFPVLFIIGLAIGFIRAESFSPQTIMGLRVLAIGIVFLFGIFLLKKVLPENVRFSTPQFKTTEWFQIATPMMWMSGAHVINSYCDSIMLGAFRGSIEVGLYTVAVSGAYLVVLILAGVNTSLSPIVAALYSKNNMGKLQEIIEKSARWTFLSGLIIGILLVTFGYWFLLVFGKDFTQAKSALNILVIGNMFMSFMGTLPVALVMTQKEQIAMKCFVTGAALNIVLNALFIPEWGMEGAALATATSITICYMFLTWFVYKDLKIQALPFIHFRKRDQLKKNS